MVPVRVEDAPQSGSDGVVTAPEVGLTIELTTASGERLVVGGRAGIADLRAVVEALVGASRR
jgi:hypothetical protein